MPYEPNYFGVNMGEAIASGAGHISNALQRRYELQRQDEERQRLLEETKRQENREQGFKLAGHGFENTPEGLQLYIEQNKKMGGLDLKKKEAEIKMTESMYGAGGGMPTFYEGPGGVQYTVTPSKYGPRVQFPTPAPIAINPNTGEQVSLPRGGKVVEPPGSEKATASLSEIKAVEDSLNELKNILKTIPSGRILGTGAEAINWGTGAIPQVRQAKVLGGLLKPKIARVIGGDVGNLAVQEQIAADMATDLINATKEERQEIFSTLDNLVERKRSSAIKVLQGGGMWNNPIESNESQMPQGQESFDNSKQDITWTPEKEQRYQELRSKRGR